MDTDKIKSEQEKRDMPREEDLLRTLLSKEYRLAAIVDLTTGLYRLLENAENKILAPECGDYERVMREISGRILTPDKQQEFIECTELSYLRKRLDEETGEYIYYYCVAAKRPYWAELRAVYADSSRTSVLITSRSVQSFVEKNRLSVKFKEIRGEAGRCDEMTGLLKYAYFQEQFLEMVEQAEPEQRYGVLYADMGNFKYINLLYGYSEGNRLLKEFAGILDPGEHEGFTSRIISDFFIKVYKIEPGEDLAGSVKKLEGKLTEFVRRSQERYPNSDISVNCGVSELEKGGGNLAEAIDNANTARKMIKKSGGGGCLLYDEALKARLREEKEYALALQQAFLRDEFVFYLQPKVNLQTGKIVGAEALARWVREDGSVELPEQFIPLMEKDGSIVELDFMIYEKVCRYLAGCLKREGPVVTVSLNVSGAHFKSHHFVERLNALVKKYDIRPSLLELELTESMLVNKAEQMAAVLKELKRCGYRTAIDDFGSEYSSLSLITELDADVLKIDKSLLGYGDSVSLKKRAVISSIADMANKLHMAILAEGAETIEQVNIVREEGCTLAQGFCLSKPIRMEQFQDFLAINNGYIKLPWKKEERRSVWNVAEEYKEPSELSDSSITAITNSMFHVLPGGVIGFDQKSGELLFVSDGMFEITGYGREELINMKVTYGGLFDPAIAEENHRNIMTQLKNGSKAVYEYPIVKKNGSDGWVKLYAGFAVSPEWGQYLLCTVFDDTEAHMMQIKLKRTLNEIEKQKAFHEKLYDSIVCGIVQIAAVDGRQFFLYANLEAVRMLGYDSREEFLKDNEAGVKDFIHPGDDAYVRRIVRKLKPGETEYVECRILRKKGGFVWLAARVGLLNETDGKEILQLAAVDITERKSLEQRLKKERDFYDRLYRSMPCGIMQFDPQVQNLHLLNANLAAVKIFGYDTVEEFAGAVEGRQPQEMVYAEDREKLGRAAQRLRRIGDKVQLEYRINTKNGEIRWINGVREYIRNVSGDPVFQETFMDSTERKLLEESRKKEEYANNALKIAEEANLAKSRFLSNMSHDIRTPMNAIMGMAKIAKTHSDHPEKVMDCLEKIDYSSRHLLNLINDVLDMSKIESGKTVLNPEPFSWTDYIHGIREIIRPQAEAKNQSITIETRDVVHDRIIADALHLQQVFINILSNAVKFTQEGGAISCVVTEKDSQIDGRGHYCITFRDNGKGMSREFQSRLFESFTREQDSIGNQIEGTGLGMAIAKSIVGLMDGNIEVESERGKGTVFTVEFNFPFEEGGAGTQPEEPEGSFDFTGIRVLIVEDNEMNQEIFKELLEMSGALVDVADNGKEAVDRYEEAEDRRYQIIFMDVQMPVMNGYDATRAIRGSGKPDAADIPIVAMTANTFIDDIRRGLDAGMDAHIPKPLDMGVLNKTMFQVFERKRHGSAGRYQRKEDRKD